LTYDKGEIDGPPAGRLEDPVECESEEEKGEDVENCIIYGEVDGREAEVGGEKGQQGEGNCASVSLGLREIGGEMGQRQVHTGKGDSGMHCNLLVIGLWDIELLDRTTGMLPRKWASHCTLLHVVFNQVTWVGCTGVATISTVLYMIRNGPLH